MRQASGEDRRLGEWLKVMILFARFSTMTAQIFSPYRVTLPQSGYGSAQGRRWSASVLAAIVGFGLLVVPVNLAHAGGHVLESPQVVNPSDVRPSGTVSAPKPSSYSADAPDPAYNSPETRVYPSDPNLGSISDYTNQEAQSRQPATIVIGVGSGHEGSSALVGNLIAGGLIMG
jgi:hypothetical protein